MSFPLLCFWFKDGIASHSDQFSKCGPAVSTSPGVLLEMHIPGPLPTRRPTGLETLAFRVNKLLGIPMHPKFKHHSSTLLCWKRWGPGQEKRWSCLGEGMSWRRPKAVWLGGPVLAQDKCECHCVLSSGKAVGRQMLPTSFWMLCQVQAFLRSEAGGYDGERCASGLCLAHVAIGTPRVCFSKR